MTIEVTTKLLHPREVGEILGRSEAALSKMRVFGTGPKFVKIGRTVRYRPADIESYVSDNLHDATAGDGR